MNSEKTNNRQPQLPELLAPCGSREAIDAAITGGADAVYFGGTMLNARMNAKNFGREELSSAITECHSAGVKAYITLNTQVYDRELKNALEYVGFLRSAGADALIVADVGLAGLIKKHFPDTDPAYKGISSIKLLEDITGQKVEAFRAPGFSIRESEGWAFEILHELGIRMDSSVFPAHHAHGGMPSYVSAVPSWVEYNGIRMKEFPIVYRKILGKHIVFSGGGYFRLVPYRLLRKWTRECPEYLLAYIHPRDLDAEQPMIEDLNYIRRFKSYYGLRGAEEKLKRWLMDFDFMDLRTADGLIDWKAAPIVEITPSLCSATNLRSQS